MAPNDIPGITIKGTRDGVSISLLEGAWEALTAELAERLKATGSFFAGGRVTIRVGNRTLTEAQIRELQDILAQYDMDLYAVVADVQSTREAARAVDLRAMPAKAPAAEETEEEAPSPKPRSTEAILVRRTVRSGQVVQYPGHVVIVGDVNLDGEVLAAGDVIIWGKLRGVVHAGAVGDDSAIVCALQMQPMQLRIGNYIARAPEDQGREPGEPEVAFVRNGGIVAESWNNGTLDI